MDRKSKAFVVIDEQGWFFHFRTSYRGWLYKPSRWVLRHLRKSSCIDVVNTFGVDNGATVRELNRPHQNNPES
jgi:hypothetical protein